MFTRTQRRRMRKLGLSEAQMLNNISNMDAYSKMDHADVIPSAANSGPMIQPKLRPAKGNPSFRAQFDLQIKKRYFTANGGAYTQIAHGTLAAQLQVPLPYYVFGLTDRYGGFKRLRGELPIQGTDWVHGVPFIYGAEASTIAIAIDSTVEAELQLGDLVIPFTSALPGTGTTTLGIVIVRSSQVAYGTLLNALSSDQFAINQLRYTLADADVAQFTNDIVMFEQSLFGKLTSDSFNPNSYKVPEQQQAGIIDIPIDEPVNKARALAGYINTAVNDFTWSLFVSFFVKYGQGKNFGEV